MIIMNNVNLKHTLLNEGACLVGFCDLGVSPVKDEPKLKYAVSIAVKLSDGVLRSIKERPSISYFQHYRAVNFKLDQLALTAVKYFEDLGYDAFPIAASQSIPTNKYCGVFQHKTAARLSGLGYIGKNSMLITEEYGSKVRFCTVLTDMPLETDRPIIQKDCGSCNVCTNICPIGAIYGENFDPDLPEKELLDKEKCSRHMKTYNDVGRGSVCGLCIKACPKNKLN